MTVLVVSCGGQTDGASRVERDSRNRWSQLPRESIGTIMRSYVSRKRRTTKTYVSDSLGCLELRSSLYPTGIGRYECSQSRPSKSYDLIKISENPLVNIRPFASHASRFVILT